MKTILPLTKFRILFLILLCFVVVESNAQYSWWQQVSQTNSKLRNINFPDYYSGWAFGDSSDMNGFVTGIIKKTIDQGQTWQPQSIPSPNLRVYSSYFFNANSGAAVGRHQATGGGFVMTTADGGNTWLVDSTTFPDRLMDVDFASTNIGWVSGRNGYLGKSIDGGSTWSTLNSGTPEHLFSLDFADTTYGWSVGADPGTGGTILHTSNGGTTWVAQNNTTPNDLMAVYAISPARAVAVGLAGTIVLTTDSGLTWTPITSGTPEDLFDLKFTDAMHGWAVGTAGVILISVDGGNTWNTQISNTTNNINSICMKDTTLGWFCGDGGDIFYYGPSPASIAETSGTLSSTCFPNPVSSETVIQLSTLKAESSNMICIYNNSGQLVNTVNFSGNSIRLRKENLSNGLYYYRITGSDNKIVSSGKFIVTD